MSGLRSRRRWSAVCESFRFGSTGPSSRRDLSSRTASVGWRTINAYELRSDEFDYDLNRLLEALDSFLKPLAPQSEAAEDLAKVVRKQWKKETGLRGFHQGAQMLHVSWQPATEGFETWDDLITTATDRTQRNIV